MNSKIHISRIGLKSSTDSKVSFHKKKVISVLTTFCLFFSLSSFDSQEHKLITDVAVSRVVFHPNFMFPVGGGVRIVNYRNYITDWKSAKMLAVGFDSNNVNEYDKYKRGVQDNCYWKRFGQSDYNLRNFIEFDYPYIPTSLLNIEAIVGNQRAEFSLGDLVALYGDYRRTVYANDSADCFLTATDNNLIQFGAGSHDNFCPPDMTTVEYLHKIAFGLVPPMGTIGNITGNVARADQYDEAGWWGDEMLRLANVNETHFSDVAVAWYTGMHNLALYYVEMAYRNPIYWKKAFHYEASALHCLTDLFAFGHVVTHREQSSNRIMRESNLFNQTPNLWIENVIRMGGGTRMDNGMVSLSANLPNPNDMASLRNDFMPSYQGITTSLWSKKEHSYHRDFNKSGAIVRNFKGDVFNVYGDGKLHDTDPASRRVIEDAVTASVQSLLDYYNLVQANYPVDVIRYWYKNQWYGALRYVPVYIDKNRDNNLNGTWTSYADAIRNQLNMGEVMPANWANCRIPFLSGGFSQPMLQQSNQCSKFLF